MTLEDHLAGINELVSKGKGVRLHWFPASVPLDELAATLVGMANTDGGTVILGLSRRNGSLRGVDDPQRIMDRVFQAALMAEPTLVIPLPRVEQVDGCTLVRVMVPSGLPRVYALGGRYIGRQGAGNALIPARRLRRLLVERGAIQFEAQSPPGATLEDLDMALVESYQIALGLPASVDLLEILERRGMLLHREDQATPTYAALLLFGKKPQRWLQNATILAARFSGSSFSDRFVKQEIRGPLFRQLELADIFVRENIHNIVRLVDLRHEEVPAYPPEAIRELLVNAVAHRDYNLQGDTIHLNIFTDRIEVHSPGGLPGPVTLNNLLKARFSRNAIIMQALADMGFVERLGYGLDRVVHAMRQYNLSPPKFEEVAGSFRVTLYNVSTDPAILRDMEELRNLALNDRQRSALGYLASKKRITNRELQQLCPDVSSETLRRDLADLVAKNVLIKVGNRRATYYILK